MALDVEPVLQAKGPELVFRELADQEAARLVAELCHPLLDE
jgi:hypothetical protein